MNTTNEVLAFLRELVDELKDHDGELSVDTTLQALDLDSLDYVQMQIEVRKRFGAVLDAESFASGRIVTLGDLCRHIAGLPASVAAQSADAVTR